MGLDPVEIATQTRRDVLPELPARHLRQEPGLHDLGGLRNDRGPAITLQREDVLGAPKGARGVPRERPTGRHLGHGALLPLGPELLGRGGVHGPHRHRPIARLRHLQAVPRPLRMGRHVGHVVVDAISCYLDRDAFLEALHPTYPGPSGTTPSCCIIANASKTPQCSCARPSSPNRTMSINCTSTRLPVGGIPMNSPSCVPVALVRAPPLSPLLSTSSGSNRRSGNAARYILKNSLTPSLVGARPGVSSCSTKSAASTSSNPSTSPALIKS